MGRGPPSCFPNTWGGGPPLWCRSQSDTCAGFTAARPSFEPSPPRAGAGFHAPREGRAPQPPDESAEPESEGSRAGAPDHCPGARLQATLPARPVCSEGAELGSVRTRGAPAPTREGRGRPVRPPWGGRRGTAAASSL